MVYLSSFFFPNAERESEHFNMFSPTYYTSLYPFRFLSGKGLLSIDFSDITLKTDSIIDVEDVIELSKGYGHWSIWFTVFKGIDEVRKALIEFTPGTCADCFDSQNHFEPVARKK